MEDGPGKPPSHRVSAHRATAADREDLARLASLALGHLDGHKGGGVYRDRDARREPLTEAAAPDPTTGGRDGVVVLVGCIGSVVVGYAVSHVETTGDRRTAVVEEIFVEPEARGVGVGRMLMASLVGLAVDVGCDGIESAALPGDRSTKNFFESFGLVARKITVHRDLGGGEQRDA